MRHFIRDSFIFLVSVLGISAINRTMVRRDGPLVRVVAFHDVADRKWFERVIKMVTTEFTVISPTQFYKKDFDGKKMNVLITFDDGYRSWIENVLPVLETYGIHALFFINSGLLDVAEKGTEVEEYMRENLFISPKQPLSWDDAQMLVEKGHSIGGHTILHGDLSRLRHQEALEEIHADKVRTELLLETTLDDFAYPFGTSSHYTADTIVAAKEAGYQRAYTGMPGFVIDIDYEIPRILLEKNQSASSVRRWIKGGYDIFRTLLR